ncbi:MAG: phosphoribosylglycinamide formyltransferase 2, partial [Scardovia wiggsiae]|nr:phosphoribosylglycinamide formyltransferase 2 [Scardovia wiggsiae]
MLLGSGELGKEIAIELMRLGAWVCAADSYAHAPAMHIAHESRVLDMSDPDALQNAVTEIHPDIIVPEVEAIATQVLTRAAGLGIQVTPSAAAAQVC